MLEQTKQLIQQEKILFNQIASQKDLESKQNILLKIKTLNSQIPQLLENETKIKSPKPLNSKAIEKKPLKNQKKSEKKIPVNHYAKISNLFFRKLASKNQSKNSSIDLDIKKANLGIHIQTYLAMTYFSTMLSIIIGFFIFIFILFINIQNWIYFWSPLVLGALTYLSFISYPSSEAKTAQKEITYELPFATLYMATIAGSNVEPTKIFEIINKSGEYKFIGKELKKVLVQVKFYGYDLVNSLKNVSKRTSNEKLSELLGGMATNISTGGSLKSYLEKKAETYLMDYKLDRKKYIDVAGTFMDIYISILIAAPLTMMLMFIVMGVANLDIGGMSITTLLTLTIGIVAILNMAFLGILNLKQPKI